MEHHSELAFKGGIERTFRTMPSQFQQAIRVIKCKACGIPFNKQYGMHLLKQAHSFIDLKLLRSRVNECLSIIDYRKTDHGHAISYQHPWDALADENCQNHI